MHNANDNDGSGRGAAISLRGRMLGGTFWVAATQTAVQAIQFVGLLFLARLLTPSDFGLIAMCFIITGIMAIVIEMGLPNALIQAPALTPIQLSSASWICLALATIIGLAVIAIAPALGFVFREPRVVPMVRVLSLGFVINAFAVVPDAVLRRSLRFKHVGAGDLGRSMVYAPVAVAAAFAGLGVWSLVIAELAGATARASVLSVLARRWPCGRFDRRSLKPLLSFGTKNAAASLCHAIRLQVDAFIIARALGGVILGGYSIIKKVITAPQQRVSWILMKVCFPGFSRIQNDEARLRRAYLKVISLTAFITFPLLAYVLANAAPVVNVLFGEQWTFIVTPLRLMCIAGGSISVVALTGSVVLATGRAALDLKLSAFAMVFLGITMLASVRYGLAGVSAGFLVYTLVSNSVSQYFANRITAIPTKYFLRALAPGAVTALAVGTVVYIVGTVIGRWYGDYASVTVAAVAAAVIYAVFVYILRRQDMALLKDYVVRKVKPLFVGRLADAYRGSTP